MAKKSARKPPRKPVKMSVKKPVKKPAKAKAARAGGGAKLAPKPVKTGRGPTPGEIGRDVVALFNAGDWARIEAKWWSPKVVSVEGEGVNMAWSGKPAVDAKNKWWIDSHDMHGAYAEGPYVGSSGFGIKFRMEFTERETGKRWVMDELGFYTVQDGKIVREEFMYGRKDEVKAKVREPALAPVGG